MNTKFFHEVAFARKNHNAIWGLKDEEGILITDELGIKELGVRHFRNIFRDDLMTNIEAQLKVVRLFPSFINGDERESFTCQISLDEIESALKYFKKDKAPGPDGWPVEFYLAFFDILGPELLDLVETSRIEGRVSPSLNSTFIALIPKKENPSTFSDFRLISLCNLVYKLISKVAAQRLKPFLDRHISP